MREFSPEYLETTRRGMWADSRAALEPLRLADRERILDVGCGTGELTAVLVEETDGGVHGVDADRSLLDAAGEAGDARAAATFVAGDAMRPPFADDAFDLVVCQALLVNLPEPAAALGAFRRIAGEHVAAIEPDNAAVAVESTVDGEAAVASEARTAYRAGVSTDVGLGGAGTRGLFEAVGLGRVETTRYDHVRVVEPPYDEDDLGDVRRRASGAGLADDRETLLAGGLSRGAYDDLRQRWRALGREAVAQVRAGEYRRREVVPFYVTVGRVGEP